MDNLGMEIIKPTHTEDNTDKLVEAKKKASGRTTE